MSVSRGAGLRRRGRVVIAASVAACVLIVGAAVAAVGGFDPFGSEQVGQSYANGVLLPTNQWVSPLGSRVFQTNSRLITSAVSPSGQYLAMLTWKDYDTTLTMLNLKTGTSKA